MKAEELRFGNIAGRIYFNPSPTGKTKAVEPGEIKEIREESINMTAKLGRKERIKLPHALVVPIPLTEEWLLKFGFKFYEPLSHYRIVIDDVWYYVNKDFYFSFCNLKADESQHMPYKKLKYVHQLQNLYFALTGEELTISEQ